MYEFDSRVRYSEVDHHGTMTVPALINYFQDCSTFQSEDLGIGTTVLKEEKRAWLLSYWQVILNRKPELGEKITIGTFATEFKGLFGNRNFYMKDADGKYLACANSVWAFIDTETGRPTRPQQRMDTLSLSVRTSMRSVWSTQRNVLRCRLSRKINSLMLLFRQ